MKGTTMGRMLLAVAVVGISTGCSTPLWRKPVAFVPVVDQPATTAPAEAEREPRQRPTRDEKLPEVEIAARFVRASARRLAEAGVDLARPAAILPRPEADALVHRLVTSPGGRLLSSPKLTVRAGHSASVQVLINYNYVSRVHPESGEPEIGNIPDGLILDLQATTRGPQVTLTRLAARWSRLLRLCVVDAESGVGGQSRPAAFQEPVVLVARSALPEPSDVRLGPAEAAVVTLGERAVTVTRSEARSDARDGRLRITRDGTARFLSRADERGFPLYEDDRIVAILTATVVASPDP
jgi:hypothetical protein